MPRTNRSPLRYIGGKHYIASWIAKHLDYSKKAYIELFGGAANVLFCKKPHEIEIYNEINGELVNFFRVVRDKPQELIEMLDATLYAEEEFYYILHEFEPQNDVERAFRTFCRLQMSFSAAGRSFAMGVTVPMATMFRSATALIEVARKRLHRVTVLNRDFRNVLKNIRSRNRASVMIYADPPYIGAEHYYDINFSEQDHRELATILNEWASDGASIAVSYYPHPLVDELYPQERWYRLEHSVTKHSCNMSQQRSANYKPRATELLLLNYDPTTAGQNLLLPT